MKIDFDLFRDPHSLCPFVLQLVSLNVCQGKQKKTAI